METCPICRIGDVAGESNRLGVHSIECSNCSRYRISTNTLTDFQGVASRGSKRRELMAHLVRRRARPDEWVLVPAELVEQVDRDVIELPDALAQVDNLILWLGDYAAPGQRVEIRYATFQAIIGAADQTGLQWVVDAARSRGLVDVVSTTAGQLRVGLTLDGWGAYHELARSQRSRHAFMAMQYGDGELDAIVDDHFRPAVKRAGFDLRRLDDAPEAGPIDNRLRVEIRRSRLLICDLSHDNRGAYFEAGFAEGLGLPVIYTCDRDKLGTVHFDTRQSLFIVWRRNDLTAAAAQLTATIRNTLPSEASLED